MIFAVFDPSPLVNSVYKLQFFTGSIARSATRRYLIYSEADFEVLCPARATCFTAIGATVRV